MENKEKIQRLMDAIYGAYNEALTGTWKPSRNLDGSWTTHCNQAVNFISKKMGYLLFEQPSLLFANEMVRTMKDPNGGWLQMGNPEVAQAKANEGALVIAGHAVPGAHGHVCVVIPGLLELSTTWGKLVPKVMNVGKDVFIGKKASWAFKKDEEPDYWGLKSML